MSYDGFFGFDEAPFSLTPDARFAFSSHTHERALQTILHALGRHEGIIVVTGDIGCGKTTLCRRLLPLLPPQTFLSLVLNPFLTADDLLKQVLEDYGVVTAEDIRRGSLVRTSCHELARTLQEFLNSLAHVNGTAVIIVDEAQNLPLRTLEQIRLLSNFETDTRKLLQIILVGQRNLEPILELEEMRQLNQRVSRRCRIEPLAANELDAYVAHRLEAAMPPGESPRVRFTRGALGIIGRLSGCVPRIVNLLCDRTLEMGHASQTMIMDRRLALAAAKDLELPVPAAIRFAPAMPAISFRPSPRAAVAAGLVAAIVSGAILTRGQWSQWLSAARPASSSVLETEPAKAGDEARNAAPANPSPLGVDLQKMEPPSSGIVQSAESYELTVASFETPGRAKAVAADLVGSGHPARVGVSGSGRWQLVIVGPYTSLAEANDAKSSLERSGFTDIRVARSR